MNEPEPIVKREMTMKEIKSLPGMLGYMAYIECKKHGEYRCRFDTMNLHIVLIEAVKIKRFAHGKYTAREQYLSDNIDKIKVINCEYCLDYERLTPGETTFITRLKYGRLAAYRAKVKATLIR